MICRPIELRDANAFVARLHRHHKPVTGHRWSISAWNGDRLVGVAICGAPVARMTDRIKVIEVLRLCTDGTKNACSFLYGRAARIAREIGFEKIQTFILESEPGTSLIATGWHPAGNTSGAGEWSRPSRKRQTADVLLVPKQKWERSLIRAPALETRMG